MTWEYIAGFFDGEGFITSMKKPKGIWSKYSVGMAQSVKQDRVIFVIEHFLKLHGVRSRIHRDSPKVGATPMTRLVISRAESVVKFLASVRPFLLVKQSKAATAAVDCSLCVERLREKKVRLDRAIQMRLAGKTFKEIRKETRIHAEHLMRYFDGRLLPQLQEN